MQTRVQQVTLMSGQALHHFVHVSGEKSTKMLAAESAPTFISAANELQEWQELIELQNRPQEHLRAKSKEETALCVREENFGGAGSCKPFFSDPSDTPDPNFPGCPDSQKFIIFG